MSLLLDMPPTPVPTPVTPDTPPEPVPTPVTPETPPEPLPAPVTPQDRAEVYPNPNWPLDMRFSPPVENAIKSAYAQVRANFVIQAGTTATIEFSPIVYGEWGHDTSATTTVFKTYRPTYRLVDNGTNVTGWDAPVSVELRYENGLRAISTNAATSSYVKVGKFIFNNEVTSMEWMDTHSVLWTTTSASNSIALYNWRRDPKRELARIMAERSAPRILLPEHRKPLPLPADIREQRARYTLRRVVGEEKFRGLLKNGYLTVRGKSGRVYQIFPGDGITAVYQDGQMIDRICVKLQGNFPPTDNIIMRYLLILNNESEFERIGIKHRTFERKKFEVVEPRADKTLSEIFRELKRTA